MLDWDKVVGYFQALAKSSDRIRVEELGKTTEGRPFIAATIADAETLQHLDRYIAIQQKLADPRKTTPAEAEKLFLEGKTVVLITCSIHATEIASTHTAVEFAYRLLTEDTPHLPRDSEGHHPAAGALAESRWRGHRDALVSQDAGHAL